MDFKGFQAAFQSVSQTVLRVWPGLVRRTSRDGPPAVLAAALVLTGWCAWFLIGAIDVGPELSDSVFYVLMRTEHAEIRSMLTGFGVLVAAIAGDAGLQTTRLSLILLTFLAPVLFLGMVWREALHDTNRLLAVAAIVTAGCAGFSGYKWLLLDPSYNSLTLPVVLVTCLALWQIWGEVRHPAGPRPVRICLWAMLVGAGVFCLCLLKISSGAVFAGMALPVLALAIAIDGRVPIWRAMGGGAVLGLMALVAAGLTAWMISARTLPLAELWERFQTGFHVAGLIGSHAKSLGGYLSDLVGDLGMLLEVSLTRGLWILIPVGCIVLPIICGPRMSPDARFGAGAIAILVLLGGVLVHLGSFQDLALVAWIAALLVSTLALIPGDRDLRPALFAVLFAWAPYGLSFGTNNILIHHATIFSGAAIVAILLAALAVKRVRTVLLGSGIVLGGGLAVSALMLAWQQPYRLGGPLAMATETFEVRGERWRVTPALADSYQAMQQVRESTEWRAAQRIGRPVLLDLTGRAPALNWLGDFRVPATPWVLSGYDGSSDLLDWALAHTAEDDLPGMWIALDVPGPDGTRQGLPVQALNARLAPTGRIFPRDYVPVGPDIPIAYMKQQARLYAPGPIATGPATQ